jgi:hypothetical protein
MIQENIMNKIKSKFKHKTSFHIFIGEIQKNEYSLRFNMLLLNSIYIYNILLALGVY